MKLELRIAGAGVFEITVEDGIAEIRRDDAPRSSRHRTIDASLSTNGIDVPLTLTVEARGE